MILGTNASSSDDAILSDLFRNIQGPTDRQIVELHMRDTAVFVSLSSRTNTRQGLRLCCILMLAPSLTSLNRELGVRGL
jgi:hypothetical protein